MIRLFHKYKDFIFMIIILFLFCVALLYFDKSLSTHLRNINYVESMRWIIIKTVYRVTCDNFKISEVFDSDVEAVEYADWLDHLGHYNIQIEVIEEMDDYYRVTGGYALWVWLLYVR